MNRYIALQKIVELESFTKAAEVLGYTQSAMSQMMASLEDELSIKLLNRSRLGVTLTIEGADLYPFIQRTVLQYMSMREKANEIKGLETGVVRVGTVSSVTCHWMPQLIKEFQELYPNVQFELHQGDYSTIHKWIKIGAVDFGFVSPYAVTGIETITIKDGAMLAIFPENHKLTKRKAVRLEELVNEPFILVKEGQYSDILAAFHDRNLEPDIKFTLDDDYAIMTMVEAGLGNSILVELVLRRTNYHIVALPIEPPVFRTLAVEFKDRSSLPIASKYFIDYLCSNIDKLP